MSPLKPSSSHDPDVLPPGLPVPQDDGACDHLGQRPFDRFPPDLELPSSDGGRVNLAELVEVDAKGRNAGGTVLFFYPRTGIPGQPPGKGFSGEEWDDIPGARGCTPQSCSFRDIHGEFAAMGVRIVGISTNTTEHQREFTSRQHIPFPLLSDSDLKLVRAMNLPTFEFPVESGGPNTLIQRMAMFCQAGRIRKVWYPVFPPDRNARTVLDWLRGRERRMAASAAAWDSRRCVDAGKLKLRPLQPSDRAWVRELLTRHFGGPQISSRGRWLNTDELPGIVAEFAGLPAGVAIHTPTSPGDECELVALASIIEGVGAGSALLEACVFAARAAGCRRIFLTTSNDNLEAMGFYQKRGWTLAAVYPGSLAEARRLKPHIPALGQQGIPIRDDLEFEICW